MNVAGLGDCLGESPMIVTITRIIPYYSSRPLLPQMLAGNGWSGRVADDAHEVHLTASVKLVWELWSVP